MKILVANLGSTSFKYRLFDMADERVLARGGVERIGSERSRCFVQAGSTSNESMLITPDHAVAVAETLASAKEGRWPALTTSSGVILVDRPYVC